MDAPARTFTAPHPDSRADEADLRHRAAYQADQEIRRWTDNQRVANTLRRGITEARTPYLLGLHPLVFILPALLALGLWLSELKL